MLLRLPLEWKWLLVHRATGTAGISTARGPARVRDWWKANAARFDPAKRYQTGLNVSDDPLGPVFDQLPLGSRYDVFLRERALTPGTPDWELEMRWTWKQRNPAA